MSISVLEPVLGDRRTEKVRQTLLRLAYELGADAKLPSTRDLCKSLGVSQATLRDAMGTLELRGLIHRRHGSGVYVLPAVETRRVAVVLAHGVLDMRAETYDNVLLHTLQPEGKRRRYRVAYHFADLKNSDDEHGLQQLMVDASQGRVDAMIVRGSFRVHDQEVQDLKVPRVCVTSCTDVTPRVEHATEEVIERGVELLLQCGCKRLGFAFGVNGTGGPPSAIERAFRRTIERAGLQVNEDWLIPFPNGTMASRSLEAVTQFYQLWQEWPSRPDGLMIADDLFTAGVVRACSLMRLRIPEQLVIATHANKGMDLFGNTPVIRLDLDPVETAQAVFDTLDELLDGSQTVTPVRIIRPHEMIPAEIASR